ncbi:MAG: hypothetical protein LBT68_05845 [Spirochaetales bacterium]|jgi:chaperonin cofactor prefoldin|nr:hypothetical protein [Spirochaetales bacterium]
MKKYFAGLLFFAAGLSCLFSQAAGGLPVKTAVLFTNGVGYFNREGPVDGSGSMELRFDVKDINDLLKSMIVRDLDGGRITGVNYSSREPLVRTLSGFSLNLADNPGIPQLVRQARGERVEISADKKYSGIILGTEERLIYSQIKDGDYNEAQETYINLFGEGGMQSIALKSIGGIQFQNPRLREELEAALKLISESRNTEKKSVFISYDGTGRRRIQAGYIAEAPVWKTSYRLVVGAAQNGGKHLLQGWGIVENTSDEDWKGVRLELISGMPVSFAMDLYQPLFNPRPFVPYTVQKNLNSQVYNQGFRAEEAAGIESETLLSYDKDSLMEMAVEAYDDARQSPRAAKVLSPVPAPAPANITQGVSAAAAGDAVGEFFRYTIENPVDLPRRQSAMIPILNEELEGEQLSIYNEAVHRKHPMNGLRLKNTSSLNLMGGPITIYEGGVYAGDARMDSLAPGAQRLISYSLDLSTEVMAQSSSAPEEITSMRLQRGVLTTSKTYRKESVYTLINRGAGRRAVLVEHPVSAGWELVKTVSVAERTDNVYRFRVQTENQKDSQTVLNVTEERTGEQQTVLSNMSGEAIVFYTNQKNISPAVRAALEKLSSLKNELAGITRQRQTAETQVSAIHKEQERIRNNMNSLDRTSSLYQRYVGTLNDQENTLGTLSAGLDKLRTQEAEKKKAIDDYLEGLDVR